MKRGGQEVDDPRPVKRFRGSETVLFSFGWSDTLLGKITTDLYPLIYSYYVRKDIPTLKDGEYVFKSAFGPSGKYGQGEFQHPLGLTIDDATGNVYIGDFINHRIAVFHKDGAFIRNIGSQGTGIGKFACPTALAIDFDRNLVVVDSGTHLCQTLTLSGQFLRQFFGEAGKPSGPKGLTIDNDGHYVIAETLQHRIAVYTPEGDLIRSFGSPGNALGKLNSPLGVAVDFETGNIIVCDSGNCRVQTFTPLGESIQVFGSSQTFQGPWGLAVDKTGKIAISNQLAHNIQIYTRKGQFLTEFGSFGNTEGKLRYPKFPVIDKHGDILVSDGDNHKIQIFTPQH